MPIIKSEQDRSSTYIYTHTTFGNQIITGVMTNSATATNCVLLYDLRGIH